MSALDSLAEQIAEQYGWTFEEAQFEIRTEHIQIDWMRSKNISLHNEYRQTFIDETYLIKSFLKDSNLDEGLDVCDLEDGEGSITSTFLFAVLGNDLHFIELSAEEDAKYLTYARKAPSERMGIDSVVTLIRQILLDRSTRLRQRQRDIDDVLLIVNSDAKQLSSDI